ncbi:hypothetical protein [Streptomyces fradiae]|uniref:hypothetical protein n=1 Tax=Streptomyces fradiae TaxID=1906 RepID=UPI003701442D
MTADEFNASYPSAPQDIDSSWLCPNRPFGHELLIRPWPENPTRLCRWCSLPQKDWD